MIAAATDLIVASEDARFLGSHAQYFSMPYHLGPPRKAKEVLFQMRILTAGEAAQAGFINLVVPREQLEAETFTLASRIAEQDGFFLRLTKLSINHAQDQMGFTRFIRHALSSYVVMSEANATQPQEDEGGTRRRYATVERARA